MTKVTIFGQEESEKEEKKAIEFAWLLDSTGKRGVAAKPPEEYDNLCILGKDDEGDFDLIIAWNNNRRHRYIYLGHWNDGVV